MLQKEVRSLRCWGSVLFPNAHAGWNEIFFLLRTAIAESLERILHLFLDSRLSCSPSTQPEQSGMGQPILAVLLQVARTTGHQPRRMAHRT
jgi:hypothetical protein